MLLAESINGSCYAFQSLHNRLHGSFAGLFVDAVARRLLCRSVSSYRLENPARVKSAMRYDESNIATKCFSASEIRATAQLLLNVQLSAAASLCGLCFITTRHCVWRGFCATYYDILIKLNDCALSYEQR